MAGVSNVIFKMVTTVTVSWLADLRCENHKWCTQPPILLCSFYSIHNLQMLPRAADWTPIP